MRILLKCPTRSRPGQFIRVLKQYVTLANRPDLLGICISCDHDDRTMLEDAIQLQIKNITIELLGLRFITVIALIRLKL